MTTETPKRRLFDQWKIANPWYRLAAQLIDQALIGFFTGFILNFWFSTKIGSGHWWLAWLLMWPFVSLVFQVICLIFFGNTPGKRPFGLEIHSANPTQELSAWQILVRSAAWWLGILTFGGAWSTIISRGDRRAWHDIVAETLVVNPRSEAHRPNQFEKTFGHAWIIAASMFFISILSFGLLSQLKGMAYATEKAQLDINEGTPIEKLAWTLLLNDEFVIPRSLELSEKEKVLSQIMSHVKLSQDTADAEKENYFKLNVEGDERKLCLNDEAGASCATAKVLGQMIRQEKIEKAPTLAPPALEAWIQSHNMSNSEASDYFGKRALAAPLHSVEYFVSKSEQARSLMAAGRFDRAAQSLQPDIVYFSHKSTGLGEVMDQKPDQSSFKLEIKAAQNLIQTACQASLLDSCQSDAIKQCDQLKYWGDWMSGCQMNAAPKVYTNVAQGLGFWWTQAQMPSNRFQQKYKTLDPWYNFKDRYSKTKLLGSEKDLMAALDFVLESKVASPEKLMDNARHIKADNFLFGWAHMAAMKEFGSQWAAVVDPKTKDALSRFNINAPAPVLQAKAEPEVAPKQATPAKESKKARIPASKQKHKNSKKKKN